LRFTGLDIPVDFQIDRVALLNERSPGGAPVHFDIHHVTPGNLSQPVGGWRLRRDQLDERWIGLMGRNARQFVRGIEPPRDA
jgi:hypothetical protein